MSNTPQTQGFLAERDKQMYDLRLKGMSIGDIANRYGISVAAANNGIERQLKRLNHEAFLSYPEVLRLELERLDKLQASIWPLTQPRLEELPDGSKVMIEPDLKAVAEVRAIMTARQKLLGMDVNRVDLQVDFGEDMKATLANATRHQVEGPDVEDESRRLLKILLDSGALDFETIKELMGGDTEDIVDAEIIEEEEE